MSAFSRAIRQLPVARLACGMRSRAPGDERGDAYFGARREGRRT